MHHALKSALLRFKLDFGQLSLIFAQMCFPRKFTIFFLALTKYENFARGRLVQKTS